MLVDIVADLNGDTKAQQAHIADVVSLYDAVGKCIASDANSVGDFDLTEAPRGGPPAWCQCAWPACTEAPMTRLSPSAASAPCLPRTHTHFNGVA